ncbi:MAG: nucleotidyltransferase family protein [Cyanobacteria bacterium P01_D01_bin.156]
MVASITKPISRISTDYPSEINLILHVVRLNLSEQDCSYIKELLQATIDWSLFFQTATQQGILPLICWNLKQLFSNRLPTNVLEYVNSSLQQNTHHNLLLTRELCRLLKRFDDQNLAVLPFKGPVLAQSVYKNISLRQISDLDFLFYDEDFETAKNLLLADGYQPKIEVPWETHLVRKDSIYNLDLHNLIAPQHLSHPLTNQDVWQHTQPLSLAGQTITSLTPEMTLIMLCLHGTKEHWRHLNRICDVAALVECSTLDWDKVITLTQGWGYQRLVSLGLTLAQNLLGAELPEIATQWMVKDVIALTELENIVNQQLFQMSITPVGEVERSRFHMRTRERWSDKLKTFIGLMNHSGWLTLTPADKAYWDLPAAFSFMYYFLRPIRILQKYKEQL